MNIGEQRRTIYIEPMESGSDGGRPAGPPRQPIAGTQTQPDLTARALEPL